MSKTGSAAKVKLNSFDDLFGTEQPQTGTEQVQEIALSELHEFKGHPFKVLDDEKMQETMESIREHVKKLKPQYNGDVYLETVRCYFDISQENLEKCRYTYQGNETYAFLMSDKYIRALYTHCLVARKEYAFDSVKSNGLSDMELSMVKLEGVREVLFQALLLDDVKFEDDKMYTELSSIYLLC